MGHPKLKKKTYSKPTHPWQKERIDEEKELLREFGLKNKKEIWRISSLLRKYTRQAKKLIPLNTPQAEIEKAQLLKKLAALDLIKETAKLEDVLTITLKDILNRRLQTIVYKNKLAKSIRQSRQFISHEHILVGEKKITSPSYLISKQEESAINFISNSPLFNQDHPERLMEKETMPKAPEKDKGKKKKDKDDKKTKPKESQSEKKKDKKETNKKEEKVKEEKKSEESKEKTKDDKKEKTIKEPKKEEKK